MKIPPISLGEMASALGVTLPEEYYPITGLASVAGAQTGDLSFWTGNSAVGDMRTTRASAVLVGPDYAPLSESGPILLRHAQPYAAMAAATRLWIEPHRNWPAASCHPSAQVHPSAVVEGVVEAGARIGPHCVVLRGAHVGPDCILDAQVVLHPGVRLGRGCVLQAGVVVGAQGFGFYSQNGVRFPVPHWGGAELGEGVRLGAQTVVAAGFLEPTQVGARTCTDSLVQIAHNCRVGNDVYMAAQSGLAGSVVVEDGVELGGGAQVAGHLVLGRGCRVAAKAGVTRSVPPGITVAGFPAVEIGQWRRSVVQSRRGL